MRKANLVVLFIIFFINFNILHSAEITIAYIDLDKIMIKSKVGIKIWQ